jgi:ADP-ribose pyrophosphatase
LPLLSSRAQDTWDSRLGPDDTSGPTRSSEGEAVANEKTVKSRRPFEGRLINVRVDTVRLGDRGEHEREVVEHPGAVGILPVLPDGRMVLVRQYRHAVGRSILEVPAGTREPDEPVERTAERELLEETGYRARSIRELARFFVSPGWANEELVLFVATGLTSGQARPEDDEDLQIQIVAPEEIPQLIRRGEIADAKTIVSLLGWLGTKLAAG